MADRNIVTRRQKIQRDPAWVRWLLIGVTLAGVGLLVVVPVAAVFANALADGFGVYWKSIVADPDSLAAIKLTLLIAPIAVAINAVFGIAAAWAIARFMFPGRTFLVTLIDLPFSISPIVVGLMFVVMFGLRGPMGPMLDSLGVQVLFTPMALLIATTFVTIPFVARELIPLMEAMGPDEEIAARSLGASGWQILWHVTLPNVKWGLLYGLILSNARAMGEFGAASVVSGHIEGQTETMPLRVERLFQDYQSTRSYALASVLTLLALATLLLKVWVERRSRLALKQARKARMAES
jgi:sulfate/thiosulfate transport system permease protein